MKVMVGNGVKRFASKSLSSPIGMITVYANEEGLVKVSFESGELAVDNIAAEAERKASDCIRQLEEYFAGKREKFELPLVLDGTEFQQKVWQIMLTIPFGEVFTYGEISNLLGKKGAARAVGQAANKNPLPIIVPCHRVVGRNRKLTGFALGQKSKLFLLQHENDTIHWVLD